MCLKCIVIKVTEMRFKNKVTQTTVKKKCKVKGVFNFMNKLNYMIFSSTLI